MVSLVYKISEMERWANKVAVVTGASSGIGAAIAVDLVKANMIVIGLARRADKVEELRTMIEPSPTCTGRLQPYKCDVQNETEVRAAFKWIDENFGGVDVLINNAGIILPANLIDANNTETIKSVIDTNVLGVMFCTREAYRLMKKRKVAGHIVIINSASGHKVPYFVNTPFPSFNIYPATKHAITAMTETYRQEFQREKSKVKISVNIMTRRSRTSSLELHSFSPFIS